MKKLLMYYVTKMVIFIKKQIELYRFLRDIESYCDLQKKYSDLNITLYHARLELGAEGWVNVMGRKKLQPTLDSIMEEEADKGA